MAGSNTLVEQTQFHVAGLLSDTRKIGDEAAFSILGLMLTAREFGNLRATLQDWDHRKGVTQQIDGDPETAEKALRQMGAFYQLAGREDIHLPDEQMAARATTLQKIQQTLAGFAYRRDHGLSGVSEQVTAIRTKLTSGDIGGASTALAELANQPDAQSSVQMLKEEYAAIMDLQEGGQMADWEKLAALVYKLPGQFEGADISKCATLLDQLKAYEDNAAALETLAEIQGETYWLNKMIKIIPKYRRDFKYEILSQVDAAARELDPHNSDVQSEQIELNRTSADKPLAARIKASLEILYREAGISPDQREQIIQNSESYSEQLPKELERLREQLEKLRAEEEKVENSFPNRASLAVFHHPLSRLQELSDQVDSTRRALVRLERFAQVLPVAIQAEQFLAGQRGLETNENIAG
ncbi:MAG: hypothetical protein UW73_C0004G0044 [Microgenomates group bacterium GW2011_GWB1_44_8]|nr:MAG: hypothetical protein UW73_C0004G0044 [Microgenomates group bacterium GW2011_GWB1_44_8]